jgi:hypothetical protein
MDSGVTLQTLHQPSPYILLDNKECVCIRMHNTGRAQGSGLKFKLLNSNRSELRVALPSNRSFVVAVIVRQLLRQPSPAGVSSAAL